MLSLPFFRWDHTGAAGAAVSESRPPRTRPHILLLTIDALSAQHMSLYGAKRPTTPNLDAFGLGAAVFDRAYANANFTSSSVPSILSGTRPWTHRAFHIFSWPIVAARRASLPAELARAGYLTGYVATNSYAGAARNGLGPYFAFGRSDQVPIALQCPDRAAALLPYECPASQILPLLFAQKLWIKLETWLVVGKTNRHYDPSQATEAALAWLQTADKSRPVFLWVHLFPPHAPYATPPPWLGHFDGSAEGRDLDSSDPDEIYLFRDLAPEHVRVLQARYDESVQYVDHYAGEFLNEALKILGDNTVVVVTADHGESFANGYGGHGGPGLYESIIHVPLIIKLPSQTHALRFTTLVEHVDIAPTLAALAGISPPATWEGRSLLPLWTADTASADLPPRPAFAMNFEENHFASTLRTGSLSVIDGHWKLVQYLGALHYPQMPPLHDELFDIESDPGETVNRASDEAGEVEYLRKLTAAELLRHGRALQ
jgi:arylsulfatase A-like enzyme